MRAIETTAYVKDKHALLVEKSLSFQPSSKVRIIVLYPEPEENEEISWLKSAAANPAFADLIDPIEDIYSVQDGKPFHA